MKFLYPEFLWALTVLIIPIVIHLFNFKKYKTLYFSSLQFIKHVDQKTRSTQRLKHILVLLSRVLAFTFLVIAFAQPYFAESSDESNSKTPITSFYIDNSFSMQARGPEGELLSEAREKAKEIIENSVAGTRFLIGTNEMSGREERFLNKMEALERLDNISLSPLVRTIDEIVDWQREIIVKSEEDLEKKSKTNYFIFSDFQKSDLSKRLEKAQNNFTFFPTRLVPEKTTNVYVDSAWFSSPVHKTGLPNELNIRVANTNEDHIENLELSIQIGDYQKTVFMSAPAKRKTVTKVSFTDKAPGVKSGSIKVADEHVFFDDSYYLSYTVHKSTNVLVIDGEDAIEGAHLIYDLNSPYRNKKKEVTAITKGDFEAQDFVVINGCNEMSSGLASYINDFVQSGGSVLMFPGMTPNLNSWNGLLNTLKLPQMAAGVTSGNRIKTLNYADAFYKGVFEETPKELNLPSVSKTFRAIPASSRSKDLILLQNGLPLLSYSEPNGNAVMFYSSIHEDFGNFSKDALFTTIMLRSAELSKRKQPLSLTIGMDAQYPVYSQIKQDEAIHIKGNDIDVIPFHNEISGVHYIGLNKLDNYAQLLAGTYSVEASKPLGELSLNYNRAESKLDYLNEEEISKFFGDNTFKYNEISSTSELSTVNINKPFSYWKLCIVLTLIFVAIEMLLVRFLK